MVEGRDRKSISACVKAVARAVAETLNAPLETIRVFATEVPADSWTVGDLTKAEIQLRREQAK